MPTVAAVSLEELRCLTLNDFETRVEPYIWPALIKIDTGTINAPGGGLVEVILPPEGASHIAVQSSMRAGRSAPIPDRVRRLTAQFLDGTSLRRLILIVVLLEMDETPAEAMLAGFRAFAAELRAAFKDEFPALFQAESTNDAEELSAVIERIRKRVSGRARSAVLDALSALDKVGSFFGVIDNDDTVGAAFVRFGPDLAPAPFNLTYEAKNRFTFRPPQFGTPTTVETHVKYELHGRLDVRAVPPPQPDPCGAQVRAVAAAQATVNGIRAEIKELEDQLNGQGDPGEPSLPKADIIKKISRIEREELKPAEDALKRTQAALDACRKQPK